MTAQVIEIGINPIREPQAWSVYTIGGLVSPGTIPRGGIQGFSRKTGWDTKTPKGGSAPTLTRTTAPPCKGIITCQLVTADDLDAWEQFIGDLQVPPAKADAPAWDIFHPSFVAIRLKSVVVEEIFPVEHMGMGMYHGKIAFIEWAAPSKANIVATPSKSTPDNTNNVPGAPPDPVGDAMEKRILDLLNKAQGLP